MDIELQPYPWKEVGLTCTSMAAEVAILYGILSPVTFNRSWRRLGFALLYAAILFIVGAVVSLKSDQPPYYYVPSYFGAATLLGLTVFAMWLGISTIWHRVRLKR
jgi:hypothetical protein